ncbi:hypothetical protein [Flavobacterium aquiphilum]|uniref:hypothetical protein n=1 Tax=Flavobacterium aquiphilum TaxID=3003261 RepID=UPI0024818863|nr:hypothetical protein [Flavobacterium aquiphilum]
MAFGTRKKLQMQAYSGKSFGGNKKEKLLTGKNQKIETRQVLKTQVFERVEYDKKHPILRNIVIPTQEESPLEARQRLGILIAELLAEIPRSSE